MKRRTLLIFAVILSLLLIPVPANASTVGAEPVSDARESARSHQILSLDLTDVFNTLPEGHHDNFAGIMSPFFCRAEGWAADPDDRAAHLNIRIFSDGVEIAQTVADTFRPDLADAGVCQDGNCSFSLSLWGLITPDVDHLILVQGQDAQTGEWATLYDTPKMLNCFTAQAQTLVVNSTSDGADANPGDSVCETFVPGECTLRAAIQESNASPGTNTIGFNIPGEGYHRISPSYGFDFILDPVIIDGTTQPGFAGAPLIELDGTNAGPDANGLVIWAGLSTVRDLVINRFAHTGIDIEELGGNVIQGNYIGTDVTGTLSLGNGDDGVLMATSNNTVGGLTLADRNIISGNQEQGIRISGSEASGNIVQGNFIGLESTGTAALGNGTECCHSGVVIHGGARYNLIGGDAPGAGNVISGNTADGVTMMDEGTSGNTVAGNLIGTDAAGTQDIGNSFDGVVMFGGARNNLVGGTEAGTRNILSGNGANGVAMYDVGTTENVVQGNVVGSDITGTLALTNSGQGVVIAAEATNNLIGGTSSGAGNLISGNSHFGIVINDAGTNGNTVQGNLLGTDITGRAALANGEGGMAIFTGASHNLIGGITPEARNVISGNTGNGGAVIYGEGASENLLQGNYIGTDVNGTLALANTGYGIFIGGAATNNTIGGTPAGAGNLVSGNSEDGIGIFDLGTMGNVVQGNSIGTDVSAETALANLRSGVAIGTGATANLVGGLAPGAGNRIAFNNEQGVLLYEGDGNAILSNSIHANTGLGIDLGGDGVTANDSFDADSGANNLQNFPVITEVKSKNKGIEVQGTFIGASTSSFHLEFFTNTTCDPSGYGEGGTYLGSAQVSTNSNGRASFKVTLQTAVPNAYFVTATAMDPANNTSEFSPCMQVKR